MKKITRFICILGLMNGLAACSYFDPAEEVVDVSSTPPVEEVAPPVLDYAGLPTHREVADIIHGSSNGSVEIFPLDNDEPVYSSMYGGEATSRPVSIEPPLEAVPAIATYGESKVNPYPGVEIFPLDEDMSNLVYPGLAYPDNGLIPLAVNANGRGPDFVALGLPGQPVIYFDHDSTELRQEDIMLLSNLARMYGGQSISVAGHASVKSSISDPVQRKVVNLKISLDRAFSVAKALIEGGVPAERIETKAYGETRPPGYTGETTDVASRRVEIAGVSVQ